MLFYWSSTIFVFSQEVVRKTSKIWVPWYNPESLCFPQVIN